MRTHNIIIIRDKIGRPVTCYSVQKRFTRGGNDRLSALKIAEYAIRFQDKVHLFSLPEKTVISLKQLISERDMYVCDRGKYRGQLTDQKRFMDKDDYENKSKRMKQLITGLDTVIKEIDIKIRNLIDSDETLKHQHIPPCYFSNIIHRSLRSFDCSVHFQSNNFDIFQPVVIDHFDGDMMKSGFQFMSLSTFATI